MVVRRVGGGCRRDDFSLAQCRTGLRPTARSEVFGGPATRLAPGLHGEARPNRRKAETTRRRFCARAVARALRGLSAKSSSVPPCFSGATSPFRSFRSLASISHHRKFSATDRLVAPAAVEHCLPRRDGTQKLHAIRQPPRPLRSEYRFCGGSILRRSAAYVARHNSLAMATASPRKTK